MKSHISLAKPEKSTPAWEISCQEWTSNNHCLCSVQDPLKLLEAGEYWKYVCVDKEWSEEESKSWYIYYV